MCSDSTFSNIVRHFTPCASFCLLGACALLSGCISNRLADSISAHVGKGFVQGVAPVVRAAWAEAVSVSPQVELITAVITFRQSTKRWPKDYGELSAYMKQSGNGLQPRQFDRVNFTENPDGSLEINAVAAGAASSMTLTMKDTDEKRNHSPHQ